MKGTLILQLPPSPLNNPVPQRKMEGFSNCSFSGVSALVRVIKKLHHQTLGFPSVHIEEADPGR